MATVFDGMSLDGGDMEKDKEDAEEFLAMNLQNNLSPGKVLRVDAGQPGSQTEGGGAIRKLEDGDPRGSYSLDMSELCGPDSWPRFYFCAMSVAHELFHAIENYVEALPLDSNHGQTIQ